MRQKPAGRQSSSEHINIDIKRKTRKQFNDVAKMGIVLDGIRGELSVEGRKW
jgi:hypothetical protein